MTAWKSIAATDRRLREAVETAGSALAEHRYQNTIAAGVSFAEYARQCGVNRAAVHRFARAHELSSTARHLTFDEAMTRASVGSDRADVVEAVAQAKGLKSSTVLGGHKDEVRRIEAVARERAAERGTTIREEAETLARTGERQRQTERATRERRADRAFFRYVEVEKHLLSAQRALREALKVDAAFDDEERRMIEHATAQIRAVANLIDMKFVGAANVDWDAELARLAVE